MPAHLPHPQCAPFTLELVGILVHDQKSIVLCQLEKLLLVSLLGNNDVYLTSPAGAQIFLDDLVVLDLFAR